MQIALGSDHAGYSLKSVIVKYLEEQSHSVIDYGVQSEHSADYPDLASKVCKAVISEECQFGILICGTGIGMSIAANKYDGIRAALCSEPYSARCAKEHNNANIITLGSRVTGSGLALEIVKVFLDSNFQAGRHQTRLNKIREIERAQRKID